MMRRAPHVAEPMSTIVVIVNPAVEGFHEDLLRYPTDVDAVEPGIIAAGPLVVRPADRLGVTVGDGGSQLAPYGAEHRAGDDTEGLVPCVKPGSGPRPFCSR